MVANERWLIDADDLRRAVRDDPDITGSQYRAVMDHILSAKTVDAVEVVRCKDCKNNGQCSIQDAMNWTPRTEIGDHFCSYGERKDNG